MKKPRQHVAWDSMHVDTSYIAYMSAYMSMYMSNVE